MPNFGGGDVFHFAKPLRDRVIKAAPGIPPQIVGQSRELVETWLKQHEWGWVALNDGMPEVMIYNPERHREILRNALKPPAAANTTEAMLSTALKNLEDRVLA
jgi:hypothetical protein